MFTSFGISAATEHNYYKHTTKDAWTELLETRKWDKIDRTGIETFKVEKYSGDGCIDCEPKQGKKFAPDEKLEFRFVANGSTKLTA